MVCWFGQGNGAVLFGLGLGAIWLAVNAAICPGLARLALRR